MDQARLFQGVHDIRGRLAPQHALDFRERCPGGDGPEHGRLEPGLIFGGFVLIHGREVPIQDRGVAAATTFPVQDATRGTP